MILSAQQLDYTYRHESDANVRERIFLVSVLELMGKKPKCSRLELHRSRGWAYKWLKRYDNNNENVQGLKNGRPPAVSEEKLLEIRKELSENPSGWKVKQIMNIIYDKTGVRYHHEVQ